MPYTFTIYGQQSDSFGIIVTDVKRSVLPSLAERTVDIPNRIGRYFFRMDMTGRVIPVEVVIDGTDLADLQLKKQAIAKWLDPTKGLGDLIFSDAPTIKWRGVISAETDLDEIIRFGRGTFNFLIPDAISQSTTTKSFLIATAGMTFERNSDAYNPNTGSNKYESVGPNIPRFTNEFSTKFPGSSMLWIEKGTTNMLKYNISSVELTTQFSDDTLFWDTPTQNGTFIRDSTTAAHGNSSAKLTTNEAGNMSIFQIIPIAATPGTIYAGTVNFKSNNLVANIQSGLVFFNAGFGVISTFNSAIYNAASGFKTALVAAIAPVGTAYIRMELLMAGANPGDRLWWDAAQIEVMPAGENVTTWHLGNSAGNATREDETARIYQGKGLFNDDQTSCFVRFVVAKDISGRKRTIFKSTSAAAFSDIEIYIDQTTETIKLIFGTGAAYTTLTSLTTFPVDGVEHSLGWRHNQATGEMTLLINGVAEATALGAAIQYDPTDYAYFGSDSLGNTSECFFQEFMIWHDTVPDADFLTVHNAVAMPSSSARVANLVNYFSLNGNMGGMAEQGTIGGTSPAFPIFTTQMTRNFTNFKIEHQDSGKFIEIITNFVIDDILIINCETNKVTLNGANIIDKLTIASDFFSLTPDSTPTFIVTPPDCGDVVLTYTQRWL